MLSSEVYSSRGSISNPSYRRTILSPGRRAGTRKKPIVSQFQMIIEAGRQMWAIKPIERRFIRKTPNYRGLVVKRFNASKNFNEILWLPPAIYFQPQHRRPLHRKHLHHLVTEVINDLD